MLISGALRQHRQDLIAWWSNLTPRLRKIFGAKIIVLSLFILTTNQGLGLGKRSTVGYFVFFGVWLTSLVSMAHVAIFGGPKTRVVWSLLLVLSAITGVSYQAIFGGALTLIDLEQLLALIGFADTVAQFYGRMLAKPIAFCLLGFVAIHVPPFAASARQAKPIRRRLRELGIQLAPIAFMVVVLFLRNGRATDGLATQHTSLAYLVTLGMERVIEGAPPSRETAIKIKPLAPSEQPFRNIIVIMDESIRGDLLDLNRGAEDGAATALRDRPDVVNFGVMSSMSNCSLESNVGFRYGIGRPHYLRQLKVNPSIFGYAKNAGYETYYFDAQRTSGLLQNGMDDRERKELTGFVQVPSELKVYERDVEIAKALRRTLDEKKDSTTPNFIYVNKMGAHYPYEGKYPVEQTKWNPVMRSDFFGNESEPGCRCHCGQSCRVMGNYDAKDLGAELRQRFKHSYMNAVSWNVRRFFEILLEGLDLSKTLIVYMADHGQDFHDDGRPGLNTHCTPHGEAHPDEGKVPLAIITGNATTLAELRTAAITNHDHVSQFSVFPSVLHWMGYAREDIKTLDVDPPIEDPSLSPDDQKFLALFFVRLGAKPVWKSINAPTHASR